MQPSVEPPGLIVGGIGHRHLVAARLALQIIVSVEGAAGAGNERVGLGKFPWPGGCWLMHRTRGGLMAGGLFIVPGVISIMALSYIYALFGSVGIVAALFLG